MATCTRTKLASVGAFSVDSCSCGVINLRLNSVSVALSEQEFNQLNALLHTAHITRQLLLSRQTETSLPMMSERRPAEYKPITSPAGSNDAQQDETVH